MKRTEKQITRINTSSNGLNAAEDEDYKLGVQLLQGGSNIKGSKVNAHSSNKFGLGSSI